MEHDILQEAGALPAILDEYNRAMQEFMALIVPLLEDEFHKVLDPETEDPDCKSIQTICSHVINSGYGYMMYCERIFGNEVERIQYKCESKSQAIEGLNDMMSYTIQSLAKRKELLEKEEYWYKSIETNWKMVYNLDQILEHAVVHVLRHRRQIERLTTDD